MKYLMHYMMIFALGAILFVPLLGQVHLIDPNEVKVAESAREMLETGDYSRVTINYQPYWENPPLFVWLQALSMQVFGVNEFAARFPNAIVGIFTLLVIFSIGVRFFDTRFGWLWVLAYIGTLLPHFYLKSGIPDPLFNLFIFLGIYYFMLLTRAGNYRRGSKSHSSILAGIFIGLAILTKGPLALLLALLCLAVYWLVERFYPIMKFKHLFIFLVFACLIAFSWFGYETIQQGPLFLQEFFSYHIQHLKTSGAGKEGPVFYHLMVLLIGCFPASILILSTFRTQIADAFEQRHLKQWMIILLIVVLVVFSIMRTKMVHYSSLAYFPLTFLAAYYMYEMLFRNRLKWRKYHNFLLLFIGSLVAASLIAVPLLGNNTHFLLQYTSDPNLRAALRANINWAGWESIAGIFFAIIIFLSVYRLNNERTTTNGFAILFAGTAITIQVIIYFYVPKIEGYRQGGLTRFYKTLQDKNVYVETLGYESYGHLFYTDLGPEINENRLLLNYIDEKREQEKHGQRWPVSKEFNELKREWLLSGNIDKPVIFVSELSRAQEYQEAYNLRNHGTIDRFVVFSRIPGK